MAVRHNKKGSIWFQKKAKDFTGMNKALVQRASKKELFLYQSQLAIEGGNPDFFDVEADPFLEYRCCCLAGIKGQIGLRTVQKGPVDG